MCGIAGFAVARPEWGQPIEVLRRMTDSVAHRGPDDQGLWHDSTCEVGLGHRRLSILDLSPEGHQPMVSPSGRYTIVYNGEIYNFLAIRAELEADGRLPWRGHSDTEIMLAAFERWGILESVRRFNGMFAFAVWDRAERILTLARDRVGEKPLFVGRHGATLLFGSELKVLRSVPGFAPGIDRSALAMYLRHNYIGAPHCIYAGVEKLRPGTLRRYRVADGRCEVLGEEVYWSARDVFAAAAGDRFSGQEEEAVHALEKVLSEAVRMRMVADVPVGAFLSGGIDSSLVVALMQQHSSQPVRTFSIGFSEEAYNEAPYAKAVAEHLGTQHMEWIVTPSEAREVIPRLPTMFDEPFADSSQIPTFLVAQLARRHVAVALTGDAGDELFAGYTRYFLARKLIAGTARFPPGMRRVVASTLRAMPRVLLRAARRPLSIALGRPVAADAVPDRISRLAKLLEWRDPEDVYLMLVSHWDPPGLVLRGGDEPWTLVRRGARENPMKAVIERFQFADFMTYLPDDILAKVDRTAMAVGLEGRIPLLDPAVISFAAALPANLRERGDTGKWLLRQVLYRHVPRALVERPKSGFGIPLGGWLVGPLRDWSEHLLDARRMELDGFFDAERVVGAWRMQVSGERDLSYHLWDILMFQAWLDEEKARG